MKRFTFELEKVLELRKYREQETEIELGKAIGVLTQIEQTIEAVTAERERVTREPVVLDRTTADILAFDRYILRLDTAKTALLEDAVKAEHTVEEARGVYLEASRDRKVLDKVKERRQREYRKFVIAEETKILDDLASGAKARKIAGGNV